jgi:hypothetical protein
MRMSTGGGTPDDPRWLVGNAASRIMSFLVSCRTDASGRFRMPYLPMRGSTLTVEVFADRGDNRLRSSFTLSCDPDEQPEPFAIEIK